MQLCALVCLLAAAATAPLVAGQSITAVRLVGGTGNDGVVEVLVGGSWGRLCDGGFDNNGASVVCAMLGYRPVKGYKVTPTPVTIGATTPLAIVSGCPDFREASASTWSLSASCTLAYGSSIPSTCANRASDSGVICTGTVTTTVGPTGPTSTPNMAIISPTNCTNVTNLQLSPGPNEGLVLIKNVSGSNFGTVCAAGFGSTEAAVVCSMLCQGTVNAIGEGGRYLNVSSSYPMLLSGLSCPTNATHTNDCKHNGWGVAATPCNSNLAVSVRCNPIVLSPPPIPTPTVECYDYSAHVHFSISEVQSASLLSLVNSFNSSVCNFTTGENSTTVWAEIPYIGCGSVQSTNETHISYTAQLYKNVTAVGGVYIDVPYSYPVVCSIAKPNEATARMLPVARTAPPITGGDTYATEVKLFQTYAGGTFGSEILPGQQLTVGSRVYARVTVLSPLNVKLTVRQCWATNTPGSTTARSYILQNKCPTAGNSVFRDDSKNIGLNFVVMRFAATTSTQVYIYCDVTICTETDTSAKCVQVCGTTVRRRRSVDESPSSDSQPFDGPFRLADVIAASSAKPVAADLAAAAVASVAMATVVLSRLL